MDFTFFCRQFLDSVYVLEKTTTVRKRKARMNPAKGIQPPPPPAIVVSLVMRRFSYFLRSNLHIIDLHRSRSVWKLRVHRIGKILTHLRFENPDERNNFDNHFSINTHIIPLRSFSLLHFSITPG